MMFFLIGFSIIVVDSINLSGMPDSFFLHLNEDITGFFEVAFTENHIYVSQIYPIERKTYIFSFDKKGKFENFLSSQGEAPEKYGFFMWDLKFFNNKLYIFSGSKVLVYTEDGKFLKSSLLIHTPNVCEEASCVKNNWIIWGESWDFVKGKYLTENCVSEYDSLFNHIDSYFKPKLSSKYLNNGLLTACFCGCSGDGKLYLVNRPNPEIFVVDIQKRKMIKKLRLRIPGFKKGKLANRKRWKAEGKMSDTGKYIEAVLDWTKTFSFITNIVYTSGFLYLCYRDWQKDGLVYYLVKIDTNGKTLSKTGAPGNLIGSEKNRLIFSTSPHTLLVCKVEDNE